MLRIATATKAVDLYGAGKHGFRNGDLAQAIAATDLDAAWFNGVQEELLALIEAAGIVPSAAVLNQVAQALQTGKLWTATGAGTANAITATFTPAVSALKDGMALYVRAAAANTTTTPTFTPASGTIAAKTIVKGAGAALAAGDIAGGGHWIELQYDQTLDKWVLLNPATGVTAGSTGNFAGLNSYNASATLPSSDLGKLIAFYGSTAGQTLTLPAVTGVAVGKNYTIVNQASTSVTIKGNAAENIARNVTGVGQTLSNTVVLNPGDSLVLSSNGVSQWNCEGQSAPDMFPNSLASNGYQKLPGGMIIQWGYVSECASGTDYRTFPIAFPNNCFVCQVNLEISTTGGETANYGTVVNVVDKTKFVWNAAGSWTGGGFAFYIAIGY